MKFSCCAPRPWLLLATCVTLACPTVVSAQGAGALEEIVVTARKREESLQDAPLSITAFTGVELQARHVQTLADLDNYTPNLRFNYTAPVSANSSTAAIFIRGIGQQDYQMSADPGVGLYLDGVYISRMIGGVLDTVEVERIEVLRGPQGTLFGRNTIGGAINIVSKKPHDEFEGHVQVGTGTDELIETKGHVNIPIAQGFYASASMNYRNRDGYVDNIIDGAPDFGGEDRLSGRFALLMEPHENVDLEFAFDGSRIREESSAHVLSATDETGFVPFFWNTFFSGNPAVCTDLTNPARLSDPSCWNDQWNLGKDRTAGTFETADPNAAFNDLSVQGRPYESSGDLDQWGVSGTASWEITDQYAFKSISSYRRVEGFWTRDVDHSPLEMSGTINDWENEQFTQEFQLIGSNFDERLDWVLGAYYSSEEGFHNDFVMLWGGDVTAFKSGAIIDASSLAFFGQVILEVTDKLSVTGGARWTRDRKTFTADQFVIFDNSPLGLPPGLPLMPLGRELSIDDRAWTPMASVSYQWTDSLNTYFTYSEGFKGGGFTQRVFPPVPEIPSFAPEEVKAYEIGAKFQGFDDRLRLNVAAFLTDYTDVQLLGQEPVLMLAPIIFNAAEATIKGFEIELTAVPAENWLIQGGLGYLDAEYDEVDAFAQAVGVTEDKEFINAPEIMSSLGISYEYHTSWGTFTPRLDWMYTAEIWNDVTNSPTVRQDDYHLLNLAVHFESQDGLWAATLAGLDVTDSEYLDSGNFDGGVGVSEVVFTRGAEVRFSVRRRF
jgi:iron complex outermembrane receptor protein